MQGKRHVNAVDATGALVPKPGAKAKKPAAKKAASPKFWGVGWDKRDRRWKARYRDADGKACHIGLFDTQEAAAHAYNAAIRRAGLEGRRNINLVVDGQLVPKNAPRKRRREEDAGVPCAICFDPTTTTLVCGHAMCEDCMGRLAVFQGQTLTRSRRRVVIQCPLRCDASTERVLA